MAKRHIVVGHLVEPGLVVGVVWHQKDAVHPSDASSGHDGGVAALLLQVTLEQLHVQPLNTAGHLATHGKKRKLGIMCTELHS